MILHNIKVALRNLMKYKLQTAISVLSIAIGIVTLAIAHALVSDVTFPAIYSQPYYGRTCAVSLMAANQNEANQNEADDRRRTSFTRDVIRAFKRDGGLKSIELMAMANGYTLGRIAEFHRPSRESPSTGCHRARPSSAAAMPLPCLAIPTPWAPSATRPTRCGPCR